MAKGTEGNGTNQSASGQLGCSTTLREQQFATAPARASREYQPEQVEPLHRIAECDRSRVYTSLKMPGQKKVLLGTLHLPAQSIHLSSHRFGSRSEAITTELQVAESLRIPRGRDLAVRATSCCRWEVLSREVSIGATQGGVRLLSPVASDAKNRDDRLCGPSRE